ncbi:MAG: hypothetical protein RR501_10560 [Cloacibacillus sp.]
MQKQGQNSPATFGGAENVIRLELVIRREGVTVMGNNCVSVNSNEMRAALVIEPDGRCSVEFYGRTDPGASDEKVGELLERMKCAMSAAKNAFFNNNCY